MPENRLLLRGVLEEPDADAPRLAYAAWCEAQDDVATQARGAYIRGCVDLARRGGAVRHEERVVSEMNLARLESVHREAWARPLDGRVDEVRFDRGFVEMIVLPCDRYVDAADELRALAPIRHLALRDAREAIDALVRSPHLAGVRSLDLSGSQLRDGDIAALASCPHLGSLRWLSLAYNEIGLDGAEALARGGELAGLRYVCFTGNPVDPSEQYSPENDRIVDTWMPDDGVALESRIGARVPWLHLAAETVQDAIPNRFRMAG